MDDCQIMMRAETAALRPLDAPAARRALVVLGMSRSGTSLVTHILHTLGARLPADLIGATHGNPLGHWEPRALVAINDAILLKLKRRWDDPRPIPDAWFRGREAYGFLQRIMAEIGSGFSRTQGYAGCCRFTWRRSTSSASNLWSFSRSAP
jgi:hypothetical protein